MAKRSGDKESGERTSSASGHDAPSEDDKSAFFPELFRRALALGLSGIFTTEEAFRRALGDTLPKDWVDFAVDQSDRTRTEFVNRLAGELARTLESIDLDAVLRRLLTENSLEVKAEIRLRPDAPGKRGSAGIQVVGGGKRK